MAQHNQSKAGAGLIMDKSNVRRHLLEGFSRCSLTAYSPNQCEKSCDWPKKKVSQISARGTFDKWLQERNLALKPILWEICSNSYSDWKERNAQYSYGVRNLVKLGTF